MDPAGIALIGVKELKKENDKLVQVNEKMKEEIKSLRKAIEEIKASLAK